MQISQMDSPPWGPYKECPQALFWMPCSELTRWENDGKFLLLGSSSSASLEAVVADQRERRRWWNFSCVCTWPVLARAVLLAPRDCPTARRVQACVQLSLPSQKQPRVHPIEYKMLSAQARHVTKVNFITPVPFGCPLCHILITYSSTRLFGAQTNWKKLKEEHQE